MQYIFLDESGDLGFNSSKKSSKYFVVTILFTSDRRGVEKIVKQTHKTLRKKTKKLSGGVLHCVKEKSTTRKRLLKRLAQKNCKIMTIYLDKSKVYTKLQNEKHVLYNYVVNILLDRIMSRKHLQNNKDIHLIAEKRETNRFLNENFKNYLEKQLKTNHRAKIAVSIKTPGEEKALQAVDFVSWSIFRKYEKKDSSYYNIVKRIVAEERGLFE